MKKIGKIIYGICCIVSIVSCAENDPLLDSEQGKVVLALKAEVVQQYVTRANDGGFADSDQIGVFIVNHIDGKPVPLEASGNYVDNMAFTYDTKSDKWTGSRQLYWKDDKTHFDAYGYYPYDATLDNVESYAFKIQRDQQASIDTHDLSGYEASDFLWAKTEDVSPSSAVVNLKHQHLMAGVQISLVEGHGFESGEWDKLEKNVIVEHTRLAATINLRSGAVSALDGSEGAIVASQSGQTFRAVVVPQILKEEVPLLSITIDGVAYSFTRKEPMTYFSGKLHKFTLSVSKRLPTGDYEISLMDESITPWENDINSHQGHAKEYLVVNINRGENLGNVLKRMNILPENIVNLKLTGTMNASSNFPYIRENLVNMEALNMKELSLVNSETVLYFGRVLETKIDLNKDAIPNRALKGLPNLRWVVLPDKLEAIGDEAFRESGLSGSLILPDGIKYVGWDAFYNCQFTGELYLPSSLEYIGSLAFGECDFNCELILPERMKYLGAAFSNCKYLRGTIRIPEGLTEVQPAWYGTAVTGVAEIPQGVKQIYGIGCAITGVILPEGVEEIDCVSFNIEDSPLKSKRNQYMLYDIDVPSTVKKLGQFAFGQINSAHVYLPDGLEEIPYICFEGAALQDTMHVPSSVKYIRERAFANCKLLDAVVLPAELISIGGYAFDNCYSLSYIRCLGTTPPTFNGLNAFSGVNKESTVLVVPEGAVEAYQNAEGWSEFKRITTYQNFVCRPMQGKLLNKGEVRTIVLNADDSWGVAHCPNWVTLDKTSGYKKTELKVTIATLPHGQGARTDSIVFQLDKKGENGNPVTCCYEIQQFDYEYDTDAQVTLQQSTEGNKGGINILFIGDGYDAEDIATGVYMHDMTQEMEYFFAVEPYKTYRSYFNVHAAVAVSQERGVMSNSGMWRDTKFNVHWNSRCDNRQRIEADYDEMVRYILQDIPGGAVTKANISRSLIICVPNSDAYEGITCLYEDGSAIAVCPHSTLDYPYDARGIIQHEAGGHGFGKLADEYIYHQSWIQTCSCNCCGHVAALKSMQDKGWGQNLSLHGRYNEVEWKQLIFDPRYSEIVDIYEGGYFHRRGVYRSEPNSCMNNNVPYFSAVSRMAIVERIMNYVGKPFDYETFVSKDSREVGDKFTTRGGNAGEWQQKTIYGGYHHPIVKKGSPIDYLKGGKK